MTKKLKVTVDGKAYDVTVEMLDEGIESVMPHVAASISPVAAPASARSVSSTPFGAGDIKSPLAGKVVLIDVKPGQQVTEGQQVMTLEAMKMNTYIYAPKTGRVSAVLVNSGDAVEEGAALITVA